MNAEQAINILCDISQVLLKNAVKSQRISKQERNKIKEAIGINNLKGAKMHIERILKEKQYESIYKDLNARITEMVFQLESSNNENMINFVFSSKSCFETFQLDKIIEFTNKFEEKFGLLSSFLKLVNPISESEITTYLYEYAKENGLFVLEEFNGTSTLKEETLALLAQEC